MIDSIESQDGRMFALFVLNPTPAPGAQFFTAPSCTLQLGLLTHPAGHTIPAHTHAPQYRHLETTAEALLVRKGRLKASIFSDRGDLLGSRELAAGDAVLLLRGGHAFEVLEDCEVFEVKQGPFNGTEADKQPLAAAAPLRVAS